MRIAPTLAALAASCALAAACPARPPEAPMFPDTPIGRSAQALIDAVNGDPAAIDRFNSAHLAADRDRRGMRTFTAATYAAMLQKLRTQGGASTPFMFGSRTSLTH